MSLRINTARVLLLFGAASACGQSAALYPQVTKSDIIEGLRKKEIAVSPSQVSMLSNIPAHLAHPVLEAIKIEPLLGDNSRVLMRCVDRISCIPFYVGVSGLTSNDRIAARLPSGNRGFLPKVASAPMVVNRGSKATLEIIAPEMVITIQVVCLQSGRQGERIKASSTDQKNTYLAEVIRPGLLRGRL